MTIYSISESAAADVRFADGKLVETTPEGDQHAWGEVLAWEPPGRLELTWHPGREVSTNVTITFTADGDGTLVQLTHAGWEILGADAARGRASYASPDGWASVLGLFAETA